MDHGARSRSLGEGGEGEGEGVQGALHGGGRVDTDIRRTMRGLHSATPFPFSPLPPSLPPAATNAKHLCGSHNHYITAYTPLEAPLRTCRERALRGSQGGGGGGKGAQSSQAA